MKAILVIDMPKKCYECPLMSNDMYCKAYANIVKGRKLCVEDDVLHGERNCGCPLKHLPEKLDANDWHRMFGGEYKIREAKGYGYNHCIDEILGEE